MPRAWPSLLLLLVVAGLLATAAPATSAAAVSAAVGADPGRDVVVRFADPRIVESSGLVARDGEFLTINDSGDEGRVFVVDRTSGKTIGVTSWSDTPSDVEAIAPSADDKIWVGDIGDNKQQRPWIEAAELSVTKGDRAQAGHLYRFGYPQGALNAEALLVHPVTGRLYIASKVPLTTGNLYEAPETLDPVKVNPLTPIAKVGNLVTDGAFFPDGRHLILRGYGRATVYTFPEMKPVGDPFDLPDEPQGEGIAVSADGAVYVCSEGLDQPVLRVRLPAGIQKQVEPVAEPSGTPSPTAGSPSPTAGSPSSGGDADADSDADSDSDSDDAGGRAMVLLVAVGVVVVGALVGGGLFLRRRRG